MAEISVRWFPAVVGALGASSVAGAYRPFLRRWPLSAISARSSFVASELPGALIGAHGVAAIAAMRRGGAWGAAGLALNGAALAGAINLAADARRSADALAAALAEAGVEPPAGRGRRPRGVLPGALARRRYRRVADISYSEHGPFGTLDVWHRPDLPPDGRAPVLLQVHGGAWSKGDKVGEGESLLGYCAERGWVCVTVNYRLAPAVHWPAMIVDVKRAIAWVREHIARYGGDPHFLAITGGSAGGHLAALAALTPNDPEFQPGFAEVDTTLVAAVPLYGVHDFTRDSQGLRELLSGTVIGTAFESDRRTWTRASPLHRVGPHAPPFFVVHGSTDAVVGVGQSRRLVAALRESSRAPVGYAELPHAQHAFDMVATARTAHTVDAIYRFLTAVHQRATAAPVPARTAETGRQPSAGGR